MEDEPGKPSVRMIHDGYLLRMPRGGIHSLTSRFTPDEDLFVVTHFGLAEVDPASWVMTIDGLVQNKFELRLSDFESFETVSLASIHECAGSPLAPTEPKRRAGNVTWTGIRLSDVLARAEVKADARFVWSQGLEWGKFAGIENEPFVKDLPLTKAEDAILATHLNGAPLLPHRGGPVRLVVPGWYGTNSVKWLGRMTLAAERAPSPFTTRFYNDPAPNGLKPVWGIAPECLIIEPSPDATLSEGHEIEIWGWAWAESGVSEVRISTSGGASWRDCDLERPSGFQWQRFSASWTPEKGTHLLLARCRDFRGEEQPLYGARNAVHSVSVTVASSSDAREALADAKAGQKAVS